jgi:ribosomal protein L31
MSSVEGFKSQIPIPLSVVGKSLETMRQNHPTGHTGKYGTEVGLFFKGDICITPGHLVCFKKLHLSGDVFTKILTRISNNKSVPQLFEDLGLLDIKTKILLAAQTMADSPIETKYTDGDANLVIGNIGLSVAVCGFITWVLENTPEGRCKKEQATREGWNGRDAHIFVKWVREVGIYKACSIPTTTRCVALGDDGSVYAFRRDGRNDGYIHPRPGIFMVKDENNLFVTSTTARALEILIENHPHLTRKQIRTVKNGEVVQFN